MNLEGMNLCCCVRTLSLTWKQKFTFSNNLLLLRMNGSYGPPLTSLIKIQHDYFSKNPF